MLRTTISRIRKVCSVSFIPRILRGDRCCAAVSSAGIRKAHRSTKATDDGEQAATGKNNVPEYTFSSTAELRIDDEFRKKISEAASVGDKKTANDNIQSMLTPRLPLTQRQRCQRIIDQAFGNSDDTQTQPERVLNEQYFSRTVNLEDTRREIQESEKAKLKLQEQKVDVDNPLLSDDRTQYSIFKMSRELNVKDDNHDEIIRDFSSAREPDMTKTFENVKGISEETPLIEEPNLSQAKEDFDKCVNNPESIEKKALCDDDAEAIEVVKGERKPDLYQIAAPIFQPWFLNATTSREHNLIYSKEGTDECLNNPETAEKTLCDDDTETIKLVKDEEKKTLCDDDTETIKLVEKEKDEKQHDLHQEPTLNYQPHTPLVLKATTAKQDEELLTQKLETIEETPIVEAHKPKLEGFNVTSRVLGNEPQLNSKIIENNQENSPTCALDEVSKRCLNCPPGHIDEMLMNEMEKLGMTFKTAHKAPSNPMEDDLVQMDELNKQTNSTIEEQEIRSESPELEGKENQRATDTRKPSVSEPADALVKSEEIVKPAEALIKSEEIVKPAEALIKSEEIVKPAEEPAHHISYQDNIHIHLKPKEYNPADDYNSTTTKFAGNLEYLPPITHRAAALNKQKIEKTLPNSRAPASDGPLLEGPPSETPNSHAFISNQTAEPYSIQSSDGNVLSETTQNAQTASGAAEAEKSSAGDINTNGTAFDPLNDASDISHERPLKPEHRRYFKAVNVPSYNATINVSKPAGFENESPAERELDKNSFNSRNLAAGYVCGYHQNSSASNYRTVHKTLPKEVDEVEHHGQIPYQPTSEVQEEFEERQTTANRPFVQVTPTDFSLPGEKFNKGIEELSTVDNITQQCSNKLHLTNKSQSKPEQDSEKVSLPEEILKEHTLNPYYVLTCNETCPISPGSSISACQNSDFVDTTETLYMKKNIYESIRPKPQPIIKCENRQSDTQAHPNDMELVPETMPMTKATVMPEIKATVMPEIKATVMPEIKATVMPEIKCTGIPEFKCTSIPDAVESMPKLGEQVALSELLRRVRERSRRAYSVAKSGKCGSRAPQCSPVGPRSPPNDPVPPPPFGLPKLKRRPNICRPKKKPSNKISCAANDGDIFREMSCELNEAEVCAASSKVNLTDEVIDRLQNLGKILGGVVRQAKCNVETFLVRDYEPWTPIPSWKVPQKIEKKEWQPGKQNVPPCVDGCPLSPKARASMDSDPPCNLKPCEGFPRRSFSMLDCFTVSLGENKVYDLGDF